MFEIAIASFSCRWKALFKVEFLCCSLEVDANGTGLFCLRSRLSFRCFVQFRFFFFSFTLGLGFVLCIYLASLPCFCSLAAKSLFFVTVNFFIYKQVIAISRKCFAWGHLFEHNSSVYPARTRLQICFFFDKHWKWNMPCCGSYKLQTCHLVWCHEKWKHTNKSTFLVGGRLLERGCLFNFEYQYTPIWFWKVTETLTQEL